MYSSIRNLRESPPGRDVRLPECENVFVPTTKLQSKQGIQSIEVGNRLLLALADASGPMLLRDLAVAAGMSASKAHRYLVSYVRVGLVEQEPESGRYDLGPLSLQLGYAALRRMDAVGLAMPMLRDLAAALNQTVALAVWANHGATIVRWLGADAPVTATLRVGSVMPLTRSATGLVFLANQVASRSLRLVKQELADNRRHGLKPQTMANLLPDLEQIRQQGYAATSGFIPGISGMAVPAFADDGSLELAVVALGHSVSFDRHAPRIREALLTHAIQISARLGGKRI
jgi:DNA-binding IclR family transcriptional regulator